MNFISRLHHRRSLRIKNRDYSRDGYYFVTICARNRENLFADLCVWAGLVPALDHGHPREVPLQQEIAPASDSTNGLILTVAGRIVEKNWLKIADQNVTTDAFVIMPNHIHGIIVIKPHALGVGAGLAPALNIVHDQGQPRGLPLHEEMAPALNIVHDQGQPQGMPLHKKIALVPDLGAIIGAFKSRCVKDYLKYIDDNDLNESAKIWQRNYYEHIIRDRKELTAIRNYIKSNPANWTKDEENPLNF